MLRGQLLEGQLLGEQLWAETPGVSIECAPGEQKIMQYYLLLIVTLHRQGFPHLDPFADVLLLIDGLIQLMAVLERRKAIGATRL